MNKLLAGVMGVVFSVVFLAAGVFCLVMGINQMQKIKEGKYVETQATITRVETMEISDSDAPTGMREEYEITVEFAVDGKKVVSRLNETPKDFYEGMELTVLYNREKPTDVILPGTTGIYVMMGLGVIGILAGAFLLLKRLRGR